MVKRDGRWVLDDARVVAKEVAQKAKERLGNFGLAESIQYGTILCDEDTHKSARDEADKLLLDLQIMGKKIASLKHGNDTHYDIVRRVICLFEEAFGIS